MGSKPANGAFLDRDQHFVLTRQALHQIFVERLAETRIRNGTN